MKIYKGNENRIFVWSSENKISSIVWKIPLLVYLMVAKVFSQVPTLQGPILTLVYPWYTKTEHNGRINSFIHTKNI